MGALASVLGGGLMLLDVAAHLTVEDTLTPAELGGIPHELWHVPGILALPLVLLGLITIYLTQAQRAGRIGLWGLVLLVIGMTVGAIYSTVFHGIFLPAIEDLQSGLFTQLVDNTTAAQFYRGVVVQGLGLGLGAVLFGVATIRARALPPAGGWLFIGAALFAAANQVFPAGQLVSRALFAAAFVILGLAVRRHTNPALQGGGP